MAMTHLEQELADSKSWAHQRIRIEIMQGYQSLSGLCFSPSQQHRCTPIGTERAYINTATSIMIYLTM
jgi:hypothetical protein